MGIVCHLAMVKFSTLFWPTPTTAAAAQDATSNNNKRFTAACLRPTWRWASCDDYNTSARQTSINIISTRTGFRVVYCHIVREVQTPSWSWTSIAVVVVVARRVIALTQVPLDWHFTRPKLTTEHDCKVSWSRCLLLYNCLNVWAWTGNQMSTQRCHLLNDCRTFVIDSGARRSTHE